MAQRRAVDSAGTHIEQIDQGKPQRPSNRRCGAIAVGKRVEGAVRAELEREETANTKPVGRRA